MLKVNRGCICVTIVDFLQYRSEKEEGMIVKCFQKANSLDATLDLLLERKELRLEDHKLFLAFLAYLNEQNIEPSTLFKDVITMPKHLFEAKYAMVWSQVVKLAVTFLTILRKNDIKSYQQFAY